MSASISSAEATGGLQDRWIVPTKRSINCSDAFMWTSFEIFCGLKAEFDSCEVEKEERRGR